MQAPAYNMLAGTPSRAPTRTYRVTVSEIWSPEGDIDIVGEDSETKTFENRCDALEYIAETMRTTDRNAGCSKDTTHWDDCDGRLSTSWLHGPDQCLRSGDGEGAGLCVSYTLVLEVTTEQVNWVRRGPKDWQYKGSSTTTHECNLTLRRVKLF